MRKALVTIGLITSLFGMSANAESPKATKKKREPAKSMKNAQDACLEKIRVAINASAKSMGVKEDFGIQFMDVEPAGTQPDEKDIFRVGTSQFMVKDGFMNNTGAMAVFRQKGAVCEILKLSVYNGYAD